MRIATSAQASPNLEQRQAARVELHVPVVLRAAGRPDIAAQAIDLGMGGMCAVADHVLLPANAVEVLFQVEMAGAREHFAISATVQYCAPLRGRFYKLGLQFRNISFQTEARLARLIKSLRAGAVIPGR